MLDKGAEKVRVANLTLSTSPMDCRLVYKIMNGIFSICLRSCKQSLNLFTYTWPLNICDINLQDYHTVCCVGRMEICKVCNNEPINKCWQEPHSSVLKIAFTSEGRGSSSLTSLCAMPYGIVMCLSPQTFDHGVLDKFYWWSLIGPISHLTFDPGVLDKGPISHLTFDHGVLDKFYWWNSSLSLLKPISIIFLSTCLFYCWYFQPSRCSPMQKTQV